MTIRKLVSGDYEQVRSLYQELDDFHVQARPDCFVSREDAYHRKDYEHNLAYPDGLELGAFDGDCLVGFVRATLWHESFMVKDLKTVCLDDIYVRPAYRRRGIAAKLFAQVEDWARERGAVRLELHTWDFNQGAIAMYRDMGMTPQRYVFEKKLQKENC